MPKALLLQILTTLLEEMQPKIRENVKGLNLAAAFTIWAVILFPIDHKTFAHASDGDHMKCAVDEFIASLQEARQHTTKTRTC